MTRGEHVQVIWTLDDWAQAVLELPVLGPCPERTVLVPNMRVAHALRRALIERGRPDALIGTRLVTPLHLALELLGAPEPNDRELGPLLALDAIQHVSLERFQPADLLGLPGWGEAFARTLGELEGALLEPDALCAHADPQVCDVGRILGRVRARGDFHSAAGLLAAATRQLANEPRRAATLAVVTGFESLAEARLLAALPAVQWAVWGVRPQHTRQLARLGRLFGPTLEAAARAGCLQPTAATALARLRSSLFTVTPEPGPPDESLRIAIYAGVHEEVEAAVSWVVEQIVERGLCAQEIALLAPSAEPYAALLRARLSALPWPAQVEASHSQAKLPLCESSDGARLLLVVRALRAGLGREPLAALLPLIAHAEREARVSGLSRAWELLNVLDAVGGDASFLEPGCAWPQAFRRGVARLCATSASDPEDVGAPAREQLGAALSALLPAIEALVGVLQRAIADEPLSALWPALDAFLEAHLHLSRGALVRSQLTAAVQLVAADAGLEPRGREALDHLEQCLLGARSSGGRFGMPQLYLGTLAGARGLGFRAVRVLGLVEGALPSAVREDPVLPDRLRQSLSDALLTSAERAQRQLADFDGAVRAAQEQLVLSAPRVSAEGSVRQPAAVLLDVVQSLRPAGSLSEQLEQLAHEGRVHERRARERLALSASARLERIARGDRGLAAESDNPALSMVRLRALSDRSRPGVQDGLLTPGLLSARLSGLSPERPISATRLKTLLECPHRYLLERVLGFYPASVAQSTHALDSLTHGVWLHEIAERFWREHGPRLGAREGELDTHRAALRALAQEQFELLRTGFPFAGDEAARAACEEICDQLGKLLERDWKADEAHSFVDVERSFGFDAPCGLDSEAGPLYVRGKIDKLDRDKSRLLVRDIKTGKGRPRRADEAPDVDPDLQLALYGRVARVMAREWKTPARVHVAYLYLKRGVPERAWKGPDYAKLEAAADAWLATAVEVLRAGAFARSPHDEDCKYCPYTALCAPELQERSAVLRDARVPRRLAVLKLGSDA